MCSLIDCFTATDAPPSDTNAKQNGIDWELYDSSSSSWNRQMAAPSDDDHRGRKPTFVEVPPENIDVIEGDPLTLRCVVDGSPRPVGETILTNDYCTY